MLVADDTRDSREMYAEYLAYCGYRVLEADAGDVALSLARAHRPEIIVLDLSMPRIDGWSLAKILRTDVETRQAKIIAVTGHALKDAAERALSGGCDAYLAKPCLPADLVAEIERQLGSRPMLAS